MARESQNKYGGMPTFFPNFILQQHPPPRIVSKPLFRSGKLPIYYLASYQQAPFIPSLTFFCSLYLSSNLQTCPPHHGPHILSQICGPCPRLSYSLPLCSPAPYWNHYFMLLVYKKRIYIFGLSFFCCCACCFHVLFVLVDLEHLLYVLIRRYYRTFII